MSDSDSDETESESESKSRRRYAASPQAASRSTGSSSAYNSFILEREAAIGNESTVRSRYSYWDSYARSAAIDAWSKSGSKGIKAVKGINQAWLIWLTTY